MKTKRGLFERLAPLIVVALGIGGFVAMGSRRSTKPPVRERPPIPLVEVVAAELHDRGLDFDVDGVAVPYRELLLTAKVAGTIDVKDDECKAGRFVKKGTLLLEIDPRDYRLEVERLKRQLKEAEGNIREVDVELANNKQLALLASDELELRRKELDRIIRLFNRNVGTDSEVDTAKRNELAARNSRLTLTNQERLLSAKRDRLEDAKALVQTQLEKAELDLERTRIVAPTDGVIVMDHVESGTYVQPGTTLVTLEDTRAVEVRCNLRMEELDWLWRQQDALNVRTDMDPVQVDYKFPETDVTVIYELGGRRFTWKGKLSRYDGVGLDQRTRTVPCRVFVENPGAVRLEGSDGLTSESPTVAGPPALVRGMFVTVQIHAHPQAMLLRLPERAIRPGNEIWLVRKGKLDRGHVHVARVTPEGVLIDAARSDLSPGEQVVVTPLSATPKADGLGYVEEGHPVRIKAKPKTQL